MKTILILFITISFCSCSTTKMTVNGVPVKKREMAVRKDELKIYIGAFLGGMALGLHFKDEIKK